MFIIPCKYTKDSPLIECVTSIIKFHPNVKILIVDSNSEDMSYVNELPKLENILFLGGNSNYEIGALSLAYEEYPNESFYSLIHDSLILKKEITSFLYNEESYNFLYFNEVLIGSAYEFLKSVLNLTEYKSNAKLIGSVGSMCILKKDVIKNFHDKGLLKALKPNNKWDSNISERIVGLCLTQEGVDMRKNSIGGDYLSIVDKVHNNGLEFFQKKFIKRQ